MPPLRQNRFEQVRDKLRERIGRKREMLRAALKVDQSLPFDWVRMNDEQLMLMDKLNLPEWQQKIGMLPEDKQIGYIQDVMGAAQKQAEAGNGN